MTTSAATTTGGSAAAATRKGMPPKRGRAAGAQSSKSGAKGPRGVQEDALQLAQEAEENVFLFVPNLIGA